MVLADIFLLFKNVFKEKGINSRKSLHIGEAT